MGITRTNASDHGFGAKPAPNKSKILNFKPFVKNSLRGFLDLELPSGLQLLGCTLMTSSGRAWIGLPAKPLLNSDGTPKRDPNGKPAYAPIVAWRDRDLANRFNETIVALLLAEFPSALDGDVQ